MVPKYLTDYMVTAKRKKYLWERNIKLVVTVLTKWSNRGKLIEQPKITSDATDYDIIRNTLISLIIYPCQICLIKFSSKPLQLIPVYRKYRNREKCLMTQGNNGRNPRIWAILSYLIIFKKSMQWKRRRWGF